jgi:hypothetical protein
MKIPLRHISNFDRIMYKIWRRLVIQGRNVERITKWTLNPLNFTTSYYYPTPYTPHPILLRTFVYKYTSGISSLTRLCGVY